MSLQIYWDFHKSFRNLPKFFREHARGARAIFHLCRFDTDGTGKIQVADMKYVMKNLPVAVTDEEVEAMIREVDGDGDGEIDLKEFKKMIGLE